MPDLHRCLLLVLGLLLGGSGTFTLAQQQPRTAAPLSVGGGGPAYVRGQDALFLNPANLTIDNRAGGPRFVFTSSLSVFTGGDLLRLGVYDDTFTGGRALTDSDIDSALNEWFGSDEKLRYAGAYSDFVPFVVSYHHSKWAVGAALRARLHARVGANRGWLDLALRGSRNGTPTPLHADWRALSTLEVIVGASHMLSDGRWHVGVAPKVVMGTDYLDARFRSTAVVSGDQVRHNYDYRIRSSGRFVDRVIDGSVEQVDRLEKFNVVERNPYVRSDLVAGGAFLRPFRNVSGLGLGLDLGATYKIHPRTSVSFSLTDVGGIRWTDDAQIIRPVQREVRFEGVDLSDEEISPETDAGVGVRIRDDLVARVDTAYTEFARDRSSFTTTLPAAVHVGADWRPPGPLESLNGGLSLALSDASGNLTRAPVGHAGAAFRVGDVYALLPRAGIRIGGAGAFAVSGGMRLQASYVSLDIGLSGTPYTDWLGGGGRYTLGVDLRVAVPSRL